MLAIEILKSIQSDFRDLSLATSQDEKWETLESIEGGFEELRALNLKPRLVRPLGTSLSASRTEVGPRSH